MDSRDLRLSSFCTTILGRADDMLPYIRSLLFLFVFFSFLFFLGSRLGLQKKYSDRVVPPPKVRDLWLIAAAEKNIYVVYSQVMAADLCLNHTKVPCIILCSLV